MPIYVINPFLQQEIFNAKYIELKGVGRVLWNNDENIIKDLNKFLSDEEGLINIKNNMKKIKRDIGDVNINSIIRELDIGV